MDNAFSFETRICFRYFDIREGGEKGEDEERHVLQSSRGDSVLTKRIIRCEEEFPEINSNHSCICKTCLRLVGCVICSFKAVAMAYVILQFCRGAKAAKIENPHLLNECTNTEKYQTFFATQAFGS